MDYPEKIITYQSLLKPGCIKVSGYKHAAVLIIAASILLADTDINLYNVPHIADTIVLAQIIQHIGGKAILQNNILKMQTADINRYNVPPFLSKDIHGAIYLLPTLLARFKKVRLEKCGGCQIGEKTLLGNRPIHHMLSVLSKFGAEFVKENNAIIGVSKEFLPCEINIMDYSDDEKEINGPFVSGATKTAILAALAVKKGITTILNPYFKPDVIELLSFIECAGYKVCFNKNKLTIWRGKKNNDINFKLVSDVSEIMTYITCAIYHDIPELVLDNVATNKVKNGLQPELSYLNKMGINIEWDVDRLFVRKSTAIQPVNISVTSTGIYSDHQPMFALLLSKASKPSVITDHVWKNRFAYVQELIKLGLKLKLVGNNLEINPSKPHIGKQKLLASDLRAAAILLIASLHTPHYTIIEGVDHLYRGYQDFIGGLTELGATINIINDLQAHNKIPGHN